MKDCNVESIPRPEHFDASKFIIDRPFPAEHPYSSHISRFAVFPSTNRCQRSTSAPPKGPPANASTARNGPTAERTGLGARPETDRQWTRGALPPPVLVVSKTKGSGARCERSVHSADSTSQRWHEHGFDQLPKYPGAKRQTYYPTPPKLFAPNQDLDSSCNDTPAPSDDAGTWRTAAMMTSRAAGADRPVQEMTSYAPLQVVVPPGYFYHTACRRETCIGPPPSLPRCPPSTECRPCDETGPRAGQRDCYTCPARSVVVRAIEPSQLRSSEAGVTFRSDPPSTSKAAEMQSNFRKQTLNEREERRLLNGQDYVNLPSDRHPSTLHPAYNEQTKQGHAYGGLLDCNGCHEPCKASVEPEPDYKRIIREQHDNHQQVEAANRWRLLDLQTPSHDIGSLRRKMSLSSVKHGPDVFYEHEGRYQRERAGLYLTSYDPALLEYSMNAAEQSGGEIGDLTGIQRGALDYPTELNADMEEAVRRSRTLSRSVSQYNVQPSAYELFRPFEIAKTLQKRHLQPDAASADVRTQEGELIWTQHSTYQGDFNTQRYLQEHFPISIHARKEPLQVMSSVNQDLSRVRAHCRVPRKPTDETVEQVRCCDQRATSSGMQHSLAASLTTLNCPLPTAPPHVERRCPTPPKCDAYEPGLSSDHYDLSKKPCRPAQLQEQWSGCRRVPSGVVVRSSCPSKAEVLTQFNERYAATETTPDLRLNTSRGKRHTFIDSVHSQVLRGSMLV